MARNFTKASRTGFMLACLALSGCGGSGGAVPEPGPSSEGPPVLQCPGNAPVVLQDDWTTFAHDQQRTGCQIQSTGITLANVGSLKPKWTYQTSDGVFSSVLAVNGTIYGVTLRSHTLFALDATTGKLKWQTVLGQGQPSNQEVRATPVYADGKIFVGTHDYANELPDGSFPPVPSNFYAVNAVSGAIVWSVPVQGPVRGVAVVANSEVMVPIAGGDGPACLQGGVDAFDETTGAPRWKYLVDPAPADGGSVWSAMSTDGSHLYFGTGNTCVGSPLAANGIVSVDFAGNQAWAINVAPQVSDDDVGGGTLLSNGTAFSVGKNGNLYQQDMSSGALVRTISLGVTDGNGGYSTPVTDGRIVVFGTAATGMQGGIAHRMMRWNGRRLDSTQTGGRLMAYDFNGNALWTIPTASVVFNSAALDNGVAFADLDNAIVALDIRTGTKLWSYATAGPVLSSPVVVPSGVYTADMTGMVYKFGL